MAKFKIVDLNFYVSYRLVITRDKEESVSDFRKNSQQIRDILTKQLSDPENKYYPVPTFTQSNDFCLIEFFLVKEDEEKFKKIAKEIMEKFKTRPEIKLKE